MQNTYALGMYLDKSPTGSAMTTNKEKLAEFVIGVIGGTLLIAGFLSLGSEGNLSKIWIGVGVVLVLAAHFLHRRPKR